MDKEKTLRIRSRDLKQLRLFKSRLSKHLPIRKLILFGSFAKGKAHEFSDIDLIIVSPKFKEKDFRYRPVGFYKYWRLDKPFDFLCYTPEEFDKLRRQVTIVRDAVKEGIEI